MVAGIGSLEEALFKLNQLILKVKKEKKQQTNGPVVRQTTDSQEVPSLLWCPAPSSVVRYSFIHSCLFFSVHLGTFSCHFEDSISFIPVLGTT